MKYVIFVSEEEHSDHYDDWLENFVEWGKDPRFLEGTNNEYLEGGSISRYDFEHTGQNLGLVVLGTLFRNDWTRDKLQWITFRVKEDGSLTEVTELE